MKDTSRKKFLKAGLLAGGALYASPAAALAQTGGRRFFGGVEPLAVFEYPKNTKISEFVPSLNDNAGNLTLADLGAIAVTNETLAAKIGPKFSSVTLNDLVSISAYAANSFGGDTPIFEERSGVIVIKCCSCSCCCL